MVGSLGRLGVFVELSLKVFPRPAATAPVRFPTNGLEAGLAAVASIARGPVAVTGLDLDPDGTVTARIGGDAELIDARAARLAASIEAHGEPIAGDAAYWDEARRFGWKGDDTRLVVVPMAPRRLIGLDAALARHDAKRRYGLAANVGWIAWPEAEPVAALSDLLAAQGLSGLVMMGPPPDDDADASADASVAPSPDRPPQRPPLTAGGSVDRTGGSSVPPLIGAVTGGAFARRVASALDPVGVFGGPR